jgi:glycosyltransferase involved in cell wall biosynthesis
MISVVIPVYKNAGNIAPLVEALSVLSTALDRAFEAVFVVDGSPDESYQRLHNALPTAAFRSQLLLLSRNFGSFAAIRAGLEAAEGEVFAVMAADLQEPPELIVEFSRLLHGGEVDVTIGERTGRADPLVSRLLSELFWGFYRRFVLPDLPRGGVDIFGCSQPVRQQILTLRENNSSLVGLLFWVGFRRVAVPYQRRVRDIGVSAWTLQKKLRYLTDSVFSFSDLPIRLLTRIGLLGLVLSLSFSAMVALAKFTGGIPVPGYAALALLIMFFGALNCFGLGVIGNYVWRTFENTKLRPNFIVSHRSRFDPLQNPSP